MTYTYRSLALGTDALMIAKNIEILTSTGEWDFVQAVWNGSTVVGIFRKYYRNK